MTKWKSLCTNGRAIFPGKYTYSLVYSVIESTFWVASKLFTMAKANEEFTYFWGSKSPFSQWHKSNFRVDGITFNCAEQYMMYQKAVVFNDKNMATKILHTEDPGMQKKLGRQVQNFDAEVWNEKCRDIVKKGNIAKFSQNPELKKKLLATGNTLLVEASPNDRIWGIGLSEDDPRAKDKSKWQGTNWLGYALTEVKNELRDNTKGSQ